MIKYINIDQEYTNTHMTWYLYMRGNASAVTCAVYDVGISATSYFSDL